MNDAPPPLFTEPISDETAYVLADMLNHLASTTESPIYPMLAQEMEHTDSVWDKSSYLTSNRAAQNFWNGAGRNTCDIHNSPFVVRQLQD